MPRFQRYFSSSPYFTIQLTHTKASTHLTMQMVCSHLTTKSLPQTKKILQTHMPSVLKTRCFNDDHLPFAKEVRDTEIGHLLEHLILAYLLESDTTNQVYKGTTEWNWYKNPRGLFTIYLYIGDCRRKRLYDAVNKSMRVVDLLIASEQTPTIVHTRLNKKQAAFAARFSSSKKQPLLAAR